MLSLPLPPFCLPSMLFIDITIVRALSNLCSSYPVDLTFHQTKQIALMLSGNKKKRKRKKKALCVCLDPHTMKEKCEAVQLGKPDG